ncbi:unnamed protein product, partial [marine sediment metagenome]
RFLEDEEERCREELQKKRKSARKEKEALKQARRKPVGKRFKHKRPKRRVK